MKITRDVVEFGFESLLERIYEQMPKKHIYEDIFEFDELKKEGSSREDSKK